MLLYNYIMSIKQDKLLEKEIELIKNAIEIAEIKKNRNLTSLVPKEAQFYVD